MRRCTIIRAATSVAAICLAATAAGAPAAHAADPVVTIGDASVVESDGKLATLSFPLTVSGHSEDVRLAVGTRDDSATAPADYAATTALFLVPDIGVPNTSYRFEVPVVGDDVSEANETLTVAYQVLPPTFIAPAPGFPLVIDLSAQPTAATGTIADDDPAGGSGAAPAPVTVPPASPAVPTTPVAVPIPVAAASRPKLSTVATLPSTKRCASRRAFRIRLRAPKGKKVVAGSVNLNGSRVATRTGKRVTAPIDLRGLPKGRFVVAITVKLNDGQTIKGTRTYRTCVPKRKPPPRV